MIKTKELSDPTSCLNKAKDEHLLFVMNGDTDESAPGSVRDWVRRRISSGKNKITDAKIVEALAWADTAEAKQAATNK